jgi:carbamoyltransferase
LSRKFYIGLAATYHDPAIAIVDDSGRALFAEACERPLQDKRAFNAPADHLVRAPQLIRRYCPPDAELVIAVSWSKGYVYAMRAITDVTGLISRFVNGPIDQTYTWPWPTMETQMTAMTASITMAGQNLRGSRKVPNSVSIRHYDHHLCHAASACYTSPFHEAACAIVDGHGGRDSCAFYSYRGGRIHNVKSAADGIDMGSLGQFYALLCGLCGFDSIEGEEWKVMGLASHGKFSQDWYSRLAPLLKVRGLSLMQMSGPRYLQTLEDLRKRARQPGQSPLEMADLAFTGQHRFCEIMTELLTNFAAKGVSKNLILGGGCALNSSWNGRITKETPFTNLHVPMAPGDDGNALGAAWLAFYEDHAHARPAPEIHMPYLGSGFDSRSLEQFVRFNGGKLKRFPKGPHEYVASLLAKGKIVGWARGNAEFGPRALGNRSILADPRDPAMMRTLNDRVKFREEFRPFAPSVLEEFTSEWFENSQPSPYMDRTLKFRPEVRAKVPAVVHVDGTGRLQTVNKDRSPDFYRLIEAFRDKTGVPMVLNTSFNVMGKPIVHSVQDAVAVFYTSGLDVLVIENVVLEKPRRATPRKATSTARRARPQQSRVSAQTRSS